MIKEAIGKAVTGQDLTEPEMVETMNEIMSGNATQAQIGAFITALRMKGETIAEITGAAKVMREKATTINVTSDNVIVDTCGTGGDESNTFNISTTAAFVVSAAGLTVAKHGNRSVSSKCGSAEVLMSLGVNIEADKTRVEKCINEIGIGFLFAPLMHGAMKHAIGPRREIGIRTIFNILGPLTNPAGAKAQIIGVYNKNLTEPLASVLGNLGVDHAFVVHGSDGLDEVTLTGKTFVSEIKYGNVSSFELDPEHYKMTLCSAEDLRGDDAAKNAEITRSILKGEKGPKREIVVLNAALAITAAGKAENIHYGVTAAEEAIDSGAAYEKLEKLIEMTNS
ncbi:anthranilate phosphoribosyltransferase [Thermodesulfobacteriota bacterium]